MQALVYYSKLAEHPGQSMPEVWSKLAGCHQALGNYDAAVGIFLKILGGLFKNCHCMPARHTLSHPCRTPAERHLASGYSGLFLWQHI